MKALSRLSQVSLLLIACILAPSCGDSGDKLLFEKAMKAYDESRMAESEQFLTDIIVRYPESPLVPDALYQRGLLYFLAQDRYGDALADFHEVVTRHEGSGRGRDAQWMIVQILEQKLQDWPRAVEEYRRLLEGFPGENQDKVRFDLGGLLFQMLRFEEARVEYRGLLQHHPHSSWGEAAVFQIAATFQSQGKLEEAEKGWKEFLEKYPGSARGPEARFNLAATVEEEGRMAEALQLYQEVFAEYGNPEAVRLRIEKLQTRMRNMGR